MDVSTIESMWEFMSEHTLVVNEEFVNGEYTCVICKKLSIDAVVSNVCGCLYCYKCVSEYSPDGKKYCPGHKQYCNDEEIDLGKNAFRNSLLNKRITQLKVKCPNNNCISSIELIQVVNHLRLCTRQTVKCPFAVIGCDTDEANKETISQHINNDILIHSHLLIDLIQNLKNDINSLKEDFVASKLEIAFLKEESDIKQNKILLLEEQMRQIIINMDLQIKEETSKRERSIAEQREQLEENISKLVNVTRHDLDVHKSVIDSLKEESLSKEKRIVTLEEELKKNYNDDRQSQDSKENICALANGLKKDVNKIREERRNFDLCKEKSLLRWAKICSSIDAEFVWRTEHCSKKVNTAMWSESFYSNSYKLCLFLCIYSSDDIGLFCYVKKGDSDDRVQWPMKRVVNLSILDQVTVKAHKSGKYQTAFNKPVNHTGEYIGSLSFIKYSSIKDKASIVVNDSIVVSCVINDS